MDGLVAGAVSSTVQSDTVGIGEGESVGLDAAPATQEVVHVPAVIKEVHLSDPVSCSHAVSNPLPRLGSCATTCPFASCS